MRQRYQLTLALCLASSLHAQTTASPVAIPEYQFFANNGAPLAGGKLCTYVANTTTPLATYTDSSALTANANPIILDANGRASIWVGTQLYKFVLLSGGDGTCSTGTTLWSQNNVGVVGTGNFFGLHVVQLGTGSAGTGGYIDLVPITYPGSSCFDTYGNVVNQPVQLGGLPAFGANDAILWVSQSPLAGATPPGCATAFTPNETYGLNTNTYIFAMGGFATNLSASNSFQSLQGGMLAQSFDAVNYLNFGGNAGPFSSAPPPLTGIDTFHYALAFDIASNCLSLGTPSGGSTSWNCIVTGASGGANQALSNLASVSINAPLLFQVGQSIGSTTHPPQNLFFYGGGTYGTGVFEFTGTPSGADTITWLDGSGTAGVISGAFVSGDVVKFNAGGFLVDGGAAGTGTVTHTPGALTQYAVMVGNGAADSTVLASLGSAGFVLTSQGAGLPPVWSNISGTGTVTHTAGALTANLPVIGNGGADVKVGTVSGNTTEFGTVSGALTAGHLAAFDASGNIVDGGASATGVASITTPTPQTLTGAVTFAQTSNEVLITSAGSTITFSTPQAIGTGSSPTFAGLTLTGNANITGVVQAVGTGSGAAFQTSDGSGHNYFEVDFFGNISNSGKVFISNTNSGGSPSLQVNVPSAGTAAIAISSGGTGYGFFDNLTGTNGDFFQKITGGVCTGCGVSNQSTGGYGTCSSHALDVICQNANTFGILVQVVVTQNVTGSIINGYCGPSNPPTSSVVASFQGPASATGTVSFPVPPGYYYEIHSLGAAGASVDQWTEYK